MILGYKTKNDKKIEKLESRIKKIESIGDFEVLMKRVARVEEQFGPILGKVTDTYSMSMQSLISEAGKTNQYIAGLANEEIGKTLSIERPDDEVKIILNGLEVPIVKKELSYEDILKLAGFDSEHNLTISCLNGDDGPNTVGELLPGDHLLIVEGTIINVHNTNNA